MKELNFDRSILIFRESKDFPRLLRNVGRIPPSNANDAADSPRCRSGTNAVKILSHLTAEVFATSVFSSVR